MVGGSPCQSFSVAGKREGLKGASGLMFEYIRCVQELMPRWFLWENVKGALSCERGAAFGQLLREMDALGYGLAWRVLDAQFFGVAQRRERLFLVGHLGDARACEVLFEPESMCWDTPSSREKRQAVAAASGRSVAQGGDAGCLNPADPQSKRIYTPESCAPTLSSGTTEGMNIQPSVFSIAGNEHGVEIENGIETVVRRLTPLECERLQGFPDNHTRIPWKGKPAEECPDSLRYKAIGNSMAVPVMRWLGERIESVDRL